MSKLLAVTDENFYEAMSFPLVVVDFWAEWCSACKTLAPVLEPLARELGDRVLFVGLNVDDAPKTTESYNITGLPTVIFFKDGIEVHRMIGSSPRAEILSLIRRHLGVV